MDSTEKVLEGLAGSGTTDEDFAVIRDDTLRADKAATGGVPSRTASVANLSTSDDLLPKNQVGAALRQLQQYLIQVGGSWLALGHLHILVYFPYTGFAVAFVLSCHMRWLPSYPQLCPHPQGSVRTCVYV